MPTEVIMPKVDMDMASGKIAAWYVEEGGTISAGEPLFEIETDKSAMEVESPADGILHHAAPVGTEIPIGKPCAWLYAEGEEVGPPPAEIAPKPDADASAEASTGGEDQVQDPVGSSGDTDTTAPDQGAAPVSEQSPAGSKTRATPRARMLARDRGLDIDTIPGSGPRGRVQADDIPPAITEASHPEPAAAHFTPDTGPLAVTRTRGDRGTPLVLIHGFASDAQSWAPLMGHLKSQPVIRIELPSHGRSPKRAAGNFAELVRDLRDAFDGLGLERAHLVGHSLGGAISLALADTRPRVVSSLTLIAPAGLGPEINGPALSGILAARRAESLQPWLRMMVADDSVVTEGYARAAMASRTDPELRAAQSAMADRLFPDNVQAFDLRAALDRLSMPTRIIWGRQDEIIPWKQALRAPGRVGLHLFDQIGHMPQTECPEEVAKLLPVED